MTEKTLAIIKPEAVAQGHTGSIIFMIEKNGFTISEMKKVHLTQKEAEAFYAVHKERPFYGELVHGMTTGPVVVMALEKEGAILAWRELMGATDPHKASHGTVRRMFGTSIGSNATHGSDAPQTAQEEVAFFFPA